MTPDDILRIARAVEPESTWAQDAGDPSYIYDRRDGTKYDPDNNSMQAFRVQCWLLKQKPFHHYDGDDRPSWFEITSSGVYKMVHCKGEHVAVQSWLHDGTEAGLRHAITEAAGRVVP